MSIYDQYIKVRKDVILALIEKEPVLHTDSIIGEAGKLCAFIFDEYPEGPNQQTLSKDTQQKLNAVDVMEAFIEALPSNSGPLTFYLKKHGVLP